MKIIEPVDYFNPLNQITTSAQLSDNSYTLGKVYKRNEVVLLTPDHAIDRDQNSFGMYRAVRTTNTHPEKLNQHGVADWVKMGTSNFARSFSLRQKNPDREATETSVKQQVYQNVKVGDGTEVDYIAILNVICDFVQVEVYDENDLVHPEYSEFTVGNSGDKKVTNLIFDDIPVKKNPYISILFFNTDDEQFAKVSEIVVGSVVDLGNVELGSTSSADDFTRREYNEETGQYDITNERYIIRNNYTIQFPTEEITKFNQLLDKFRNRVLLYVASDQINSMQHLGVYRHYDFVLTYPTYSVVNIEVVGFNNINLKNYDNPDFFDKAPKPVIAEPQPLNEVVNDTEFRIITEQDETITNVYWEVDDEDDNPLTDGSVSSGNVFTPDLTDIFAETRFKLRVNYNTTNTQSPFTDWLWYVKGITAGNFPLIKETSRSIDGAVLGERGVTISPDGYRIVICKDQWITQYKLHVPFNLTHAEKEVSIPTLLHTLIYFSEDGKMFAYLRPTISGYKFRIFDLEDPFNLARRKPRIERDLTNADFGDRVDIIYWYNEGLSAALVNHNTGVTRYVHVDDAYDLESKNFHMSFTISEFEDAVHITFDPINPYHMIVIYKDKSVKKWEVQEEGNPSQVGALVESGSFDVPFNIYGATTNKENTKIYAHNEDKIFEVNFG